METRKLLHTIGRRRFLGLCLPATAAAVFVSQAEAYSSQFYTPKKNLGGRWAFTPDPALPNVLLIGDSISIGYTLDVRRLLRRKANVFLPMNAHGSPVNCGNTRFGLEHIHSWLGKTKWSVIHFNWGLHDLCYRSPQSKVYGHRDKVRGVQDVPIAQYKKNLEELVPILERTKATLIWANTTVIPPHEAGRFVGNEVVYNEVAAQVMRKYHIRTDDLYSLTKQFSPTSFRAPGDVHFTEVGFERIAEQVAYSIRKALSERHSEAETTRRSDADQLADQPRVSFPDFNEGKPL